MHRLGLCVIMARIETLNHSEILQFSLKVVDTVLEVNPGNHLIFLDHSTPFVVSSCEVVLHSSHDRVLLQ